MISISCEKVSVPQTFVTVKVTVYVPGCVKDICGLV